MIAQRSRHRKLPLSVRGQKPCLMGKDGGGYNLCGDGWGCVNFPLLCRSLMWNLAAADVALFCICRLITGEKQQNLTWCMWIKTSMQNNSCHIVRRISKWVPAESLSMNSTNLFPMSNHLQDIVDYRSNLCCQRRSASLQCSCSE